MITKTVNDWYRKTTVVYTRALTDHKSAQCGVCEYPERIVFVSYSTPVIELLNNGWLTCYGTYSRTTIRQIGWFLREYAPHISYHLVKQLYEDKRRLNIYTMEIEDI